MSDAEHVRVDRDRGFFKCHTHDDVCGFPPHAGQRLERFAIAWNLAIVLFDETARGADDVARLHAEKTGRLYDLLDVFLFCVCKLLRCRILFEKRRGHHVDARVRRLRGENYRDEQLKRIFVIQRSFRVRIRPL